MAIKPCEECGGPVSDKAESCPMCEVKKTNKNSIISWVFVVILIFGGGWWFINILSSGAISGKAEPAPQIMNQGKVEESWIYKNAKDEMRGQEAKFATTVSTNSVDFDFPYNGGSKLILTLRKSGNETDVMVTVSKGQILCEIRGCETAFKFDTGAVQTITMTEPDNHASDVLFVMHDKTEDKIINHLKTSKKLIIEVPFYQEGKKQFTFDVSSLKWD